MVEAENPRQLRPVPPNRTKPALQESCDICLAHAFGSSNNIFRMEVYESSFEVHTQNLAVKYVCYVVSLAGLYIDLPMWKLTVNETQL